MDRGLSTGTHQQHDGLRERNAASQQPSTTATTTSPEALAAAGELEPQDKPGGDGKAFGRTPDGTGTFLVFKPVI